MAYRISGAVPRFIALGLGGILLAGAPAAALAATGTAKSASADSADKAANKPASRVEEHIKELHTKLHITQAQEAQFSSLAQVMRDNAQQMGAAIAARDQGAETANAVENLKSYQNVADTHADGLKKLIPAFQSFYDTLSDSQKKAADELFRGKVEKHERKS